jgi:predicted Zn-dependent peptidase
MFAEVARLRDQPLTDKELTDLIAVFVTDYYTGLDSNGALAGKLGWWHLLGGGRENADRLIERISQVTAEDIQRVSQTYLTDFQFGVLGDPAAVSLELFTEAAGEESAEP